MFIKIMLIPYLIGNFSSAYFIGKIYKKEDIRSFGSGNAGATNALRVYGLKAGSLTLFLDILKGIVATYIGYKTFGLNGSLISGLFVVIGHCWPILLGFKGGKGVATSIGVLFYIEPIVLLILIVVSIVIVYFTRYISLASIVSFLLLPIVGLFIYSIQDLKILSFNFILSLIIIFKHRSNIKRLLKGEESKLGDKINRGV